jgi:predicted N-acetyltransferase YhbS
MRAGKMSNLSELFREARQYGLVRVVTSDDGAYYCNIEFSTIKHTRLQAESGWRHKTPEDAVMKAISVAKEIVNSITESIEPMKELAKL